MINPNPLKHFQHLQEKIKSYFTGTDSNEPQGRTQITTKKWLNLGLVVFVLVSSFILLISFISSRGGPNENLSDQSMAQSISSYREGAESSDSLKHKKIELGSDAIKGEVKWQNFLEDRVDEEGKTREEQIGILKDVITKTHETAKEEVSSELEELKARLSYALNEIERLKTDNQNIGLDIATLTAEGNKGVLPPAELNITQIDTKPVTSPPVSSYNYIPATSYVSGHLLGGIAVSTSVNSAHEPIPVVIKLTDRGNLPAKFAVDIKECRLLASSYGDISSERAIIRAEELVCEDKKAGLITSTKVSGVIYGDDGANGIRGSVVSMSEKHLKNAVIGGVLSGFSNTAKGQGSFDITPLGLSTKKKGMKTMATEGALGGASSAAEKLADYHIKLAENISPVILVPGGTKVDVVFTKSVEIGSCDIEEVINAERAGGSK